MSDSPHYRDTIGNGLLDDGRLRLLLLGLFMFLLICVLAGRLYYVQLYHGEEHRKLIAGQSIRRIRIPGWRGNIYSADGVLFAGNRTAYDLVFFPAEMHVGGRRRTINHMKNLAAQLARHIGRSDFPGEAEIERHLWIAPGMPMVIFENLSRAELARSFEIANTLSGVDVQSSALRVYPQGEAAAHIIGFARKADAATASDRKHFFYYLPDMVGRSGIEAACDEFNFAQGLRGIPGRQVVQVNNIGFVHKELLGKVEPMHGNNVVLTIDSKAQFLAMDLLRQRTGAMVVVDADNGDIICAVSSPAYSLAEFSPRLSPAYYSSLQHDPELPLINRALHGTYPPGSTIKPLICLALLKGGVKAEDTIFCEGFVKIGNARIRCQAHRYGGSDIDMTTALEKSCNSYMITNALKVGFPALAGMVRSACFGERSGLELRDHAGTFPFNGKVSEHDIALLSIGQGPVTTTPLQLALYAAALCNGGKIYRPHLVSRVTDFKGETIQERRPELRGYLDAGEAELAIIRDGMFRVVNSGGGSGRRGAVEGLKIHGKTGTAELGRKPNLRHITHFICFVSHRGRRYAAAVTVEDGKSGGGTCAPIAAEFFREYLKPDVYDMLEY